MEEKLIYLADDDEDIRALGERLLTRKGFSTRLFQDGNSLEAALEKFPQDILAVITDNHMPGLDGIDIVGRFSHLPEYSQTPFIIASSNHKIKEAALEAGAYALLKKPTEYRKMPEVIKKALNNFRYKI